MHPREAEQTPLRIGVDVGGTFTDLVAFDGNSLQIGKVPSTPPEFHRGVIEAVCAVLGEARTAHVIHGSTVATNALLQRAGAPIAFITTEGFRDMLLIARQNRPRLYALQVQRPEPITPSELCFTVRERIDAAGNVLVPVDRDQVQQIATELKRRGVEHVAVCLLFSFVNTEHERAVGRILEDAGLTVSLSSELLPEFREYERASTTAINASLRPTVQAYLGALARELPEVVTDLRIMQSGGGTASAGDASRHAAKLVLSGPAGGVIGARFVARAAGLRDIITYDMGGTSTDVATILNAQPQWTTSSTVDGLPIALPMFDINTVGAGGGSIACIDTGGALRVGPRSAGAVPGPACYARGGCEPTVTDANLILGRIPADQLLGGTLRLDLKRAHEALQPLASAMGKTIIETALGIITIAEAKMAHAIRAVTAQRGHDPRQFTLVSFGGAGGLHACALADALEIPRVLVPPYAGVLSALGMVVAPPLVDVSRTVVQLGDQLDDARIAAEFGALNLQAMAHLPAAETARVEPYADLRFAGQSHELKISVRAPRWAEIERDFLAAYAQRYGQVPQGRAIELVTLRLRRIGHEPAVTLPRVERESIGDAFTITLTDAAGRKHNARAATRAQIIGESLPGPLLILDREATTYVSPAWRATVRDDGAMDLARHGWDFA